MIQRNKTVIVQKRQFPVSIDIAGIEVIGGKRNGFVFKQIDIFKRL